MNEKENESSLLKGSSCYCLSWGKVLQMRKIDYSQMASLLKCTQLENMLKCIHQIFLKDEKHISRTLTVCYFDSHVLCGV